jgi:hypothetical protein
MKKIKFQWFRSENQDLNITIVLSKSVCDRYGFDDGMFEFEFEDPKELALSVDELCEIAVDRMIDENLDYVTPGLEDEFMDYIQDHSNWEDPEKVNVLVGAAVVEMLERMGMLPNQTSSLIQ